MAVAYSEFRNLIGRIDNDNRPGFFAVKRRVSRRNCRRSAPTRWSSSMPISPPGWSRRPACCGRISSTASGPASPPDYWPTCVISRNGCATRSATATARRCRSGTWSGPRDRAERLEHGRQPRELHQPDPRPGRGGAALLRLPLHRHPLRQLSRPRPADHDRGADAGRRDRRRLRGHADQRHGHRRARREVRAARDPVQPVPRHGRPQLPASAASATGWRAC